MSPAPPLRLSPAECTCFRIRGAARRVTQIYSRHLAPTGLKISQFSLLGFVAAEGPISIGRLADLLATDRTTLTRNLRPLLQGGLVERAASGDKRRHELVATPDGRALFKRALPLWVAAEAGSARGDGRPAHRRPARRPRPLDGKAGGALS